jgi:hypothetical protein
MLHPQVSTQIELDNASLILLLKDSDAMNLDDPLGVVSLRFPGWDRKSDDFDEKEFSANFDEPIDLNGCIHKTGRLKGTITVSWKKEHREKALNWYQNDSSDCCECMQNCCQGGCQCTVQ